MEGKGGSETGERIQEEDWGRNGRGWRSRRDCRSIGVRRRWKTLEIEEGGRVSEERGEEGGGEREISETRGGVIGGWSKKKNFEEKDVEEEEEDYRTRRWN